MNAEQLKTLTASTVQKLINAAADEAKAWINTGKIIKDFIVSIQEDTERDAYKILSSSSDCPYQDKQLRNYVRCYDLYNELKIEDDNLAMTHFIAVMNYSLTTAEKKQLLQGAIDNDLSISQFRELVRHFRVGNKDGMEKSRVPKSKLPILFQKAHFRYLKALENVHDKEHDAVAKSIREIVQFALSKGYKKADFFEVPS